MNNFDIGVIGVGMAGAFACLKIAKDHKNIKAIAFDIGRPPAKRRQQLIGFLGCLPNSDGKLYLNNLNKIKDIAGLRRVKSANTWLDNILSNINDFKIIKDHSPQAAIDKKINKLGFQTILNDYIQLYPKDIHILSKYMANIFDNAGNIDFHFDTEVNKIYKKKGKFIIVYDGAEVSCKKLIFAPGRAGWRWTKDIFSDFGIIESDDNAKFGVRIEMHEDLLKDFNKSNCSLIRDDLEVGPFSWSGTVIPEDHVDMAISSFRANEDRWKSEKVSFSVIGNRPFQGLGSYQTDRLAKLTFILSNDRILKEKTSHIISGKSKISIMPEYDWLKSALVELSGVIPELLTKSHFHVPTIMPLVPKINLGNNFESEIDGMFVAGESAGLSGLLNAAITGIIAVNEALK